MKLNLNEDRVLEILEALKELKVGVIGDFALDAYWYADMTRSEISRETPRYIRPVIRETYSPGGAGNVANNVKALGVKEVLGVTVLGNDWRGRILKNELEKVGVRLEYTVFTDKRVTQTYVKPILLGYESQQEDSRIDFINTDYLSEGLEREVLAEIEKCVDRVEVLLLADYLENGIFTERIRKELSEIAAENKDKIFVADSRTRIKDFTGMVIKPNRVEAVEAVFPGRDPRSFKIDDLWKVGGKLQAWTGKPVVITVGGEGALLFTETLSIHIPAAPTSPPIDPVGAGDTFLAAFGSCLGVEAEPWEAVAIANLAASVILKKLNTTGTASPEEILTKLREVKDSWRDWPSQKM